MAENCLEVLAEEADLLTGCCVTVKGPQEPLVFSSSEPIPAARKSRVTVCGDWRLPAVIDGLWEPRRPRLGPVERDSGFCCPPAFLLPHLP